MINNKEIANLRRSYSLKELSKKNVDISPFNQFRVWLNEALNSSIIDPNAMTLATCGKSLIPSTRIILLKGISDEGFIFYTNYGSQKGNNLYENENAALNFFWRELERQVNIKGKVHRLSKEQSLEYFSSRPVNTRIAAWVSEQSKEIPNREYLEKRFNEYKTKFKDDDVPLPEFWGGFILEPTYIEFWQGRENRLHDRIAYILENNNWRITRLSP